MDRSFASLLLLTPLLLPGTAFAAGDTVRIDGSSTVYPITEAVAEEFQIEHRGTYRVTVGISGTGGGFKKFCRGDIDIADASRPIKASEREACAANGIAYIELPVALDALAVVVNPANDWISCTTIEQLRTIWEPAAQEKILRWNQVDPAWPDRPLRLFGPGTDSGTYDYFTEAVIGEEGASRGDYTASEDDNVLVQGVANDEGALGFFGFAYYVENRDKLKAVAIRNPETGECVEPSIENAKSGLYQPLSRPLFVYVNAEALDRPAVAAFMDMYLGP
ncbi:MAG TPA: PstS family phosphate ABC transporter substrate-binding protein, partial [Rhodospirillales bacterium]|nr:PstS family phosphate ABC transporter substrate-binding protein [Rhodospirillales bacterium]